MKSAALIRQGCFSETDAKHVAEELESMGKNEKRELISRLSVQLAHLLKWRFQPARRSNSWRYTVKEQRLEVLELLEDSPSLRHELESRLDYAYQKAALLAAIETGFSESHFPQNCPFTLERGTR